MPLDDNVKSEEPPRREDVLARIYELAMECAESADRMIESMATVPPAQYGGESVYHSVKALLEGQKLTFNMIRNLCAVVDAVHQRKPLQPWHWSGGDPTG